MGLIARTAEVWRRTRVLELSHEPAARLLPPGERWRPRTWAHFRYVVLGHLQVEGAHSLAELERNSPEVLGLALSGRELQAVLESCRRRGFVARLDPGAGALKPHDEWIATEGGRRAARPAIPWFLGHAGRVSVAMFGTVVSLVGLLGIRLSGETSSKVFAIGFPVAMGLGIAFWAIVWFRHRSSGGRGGRVVAEDWLRWRHERQALRAVAFKRFPWKWLFLSLAAATTGLGLGVTGHDDALVVALILGYLFFIPVFFWTGRWSEIESSGRNAHLDAVIGEAIREIEERQSAPAVPEASTGEVD
jgi:hypothetical protein